MAFVQVELNAEMIVDAMAEEGPFALEMWEMLAERLNMGALADDFSDMLYAIEVENFEEIADAVKRLSGAIEFQRTNRSGK